jgi:hypothetical protein
LPRTQTPSPSPSLTKRPSTKLLPGRASAFTHSLGGKQSLAAANACGYAGPMKLSNHRIRSWLISAFWWTLIGAVPPLFLRPHSVARAVEIWIAIGGVGFLISVTVGAWWVDSGSRKRSRALIRRLHEQGILPPRASPK